MPVNANILANMQPFNLPDTIASAEDTKYMRVRNELLGYQADEEKELAKRREERRRIEALYAEMPARMEQYEKLGMQEELLQTRDAYMAGKEQELRMIEIIAAEATPENWKRIREGYIQAGIIDGDDTPIAYDQKWINAQLGRVKSDMAVITTRYGELDEAGDPTGVTLSQDRVQQQGEIIEEYEPYEASADIKARVNPGGGTSGKPWQMSAGDSNSIRNHAAMIFGGTFDPTSQKFIGIREGKELMVTALSKRAAEIYNEGGGQIPHDVAVAQAAEEFGQVLPTMSDPGGDNPVGIVKPE